MESKGILTLNQQVDKRILENVTHIDQGVTLTENDKQKIFQICRVTIENTFNKKSVDEKMFSNLSDAFKYKAVKAYISFYKKGELRACYSGGEEEETLLTKIIKGTLNAIEDKRFGGKLKHSEIADIYLDVTLMIRPKQFRGKSLSELKNHIELGCHSIQISLNDKRAFFKSSVPIKKQYDFAKTFDRLIRKAGMEKDDINNKDFLVTIYDTIQFMEDFDNRFKPCKVIDLYRGNKVYYQSPIDRFTLEQSLRMGGDYMLKHINKGGRITYSYHPYENEKSRSNAPVAVLRGLASIWILADLANYFAEPKYRDAAKEALSYYIQQFYYFEEENNFGFLKVKDTATLGHAAFLILCFITIGEDEFYRDVREKVTQFILAMVDKDKHFLYPMYLPDKKSGFEAKQIYYPGEALTALMFLYQKDLYYPYLEIAENAFPYYLDLFRTSEVRINMSAWISKAYNKVFAATGKQCYADFLFEVNDNMLKYQKGLDTTYMDRMGCYSTSGNSSAAGVFTESLAEGYSVAKYLGDAERMQRYSEGMWMTMRYIQQMQYHPEECKPFPHADLIVGGIRTGLFEPEIRIDNVQHCSCAILKTLQLLDCYY